MYSRADNAPRAARRAFRAQRQCCRCHAPGEQIQVLPDHDRVSAAGAHDPDAAGLARAREQRKRAARLLRASSIFAAQFKSDDPSWRMSQYPQLETELVQKLLYEPPHPAPSKAYVLNDDRNLVWQGVIGI
jgi:hypothetical protein